MKLTYDAAANAAYLQLRDKTGDIETITVADELHVDLLPDGSVFGVEFLNAAEQFGAGWNGRIEVADRASGKEKARKVA